MNKKSKHWHNKLFHSDLNFPTRLLLLTISVQENPPGNDLGKLAQQTGIKPNRIRVYFDIAVKEKWMNKSGNLLGNQGEIIHFLDRDLTSHNISNIPYQKEFKKRNFPLNHPPLHNPPLLIPILEKSPLTSKNPEKTNPKNGSGRTKYPSKNHCPIIEENPYLILAEKLAQIIQSYKNIKFPKIQITQWAREFKKLEKYEVNLPRMKKALEWYVNNCGDKYCPVIESGNSFRTKFIKLENQMKKDKVYQNKNNKSKYSHLSKKHIVQRI